MGAAHRCRRMAGFGLAELLVALVVGLLVLVGAVSLLQSAGQAATLAADEARLQQDARTVFQVMAGDLRGAAGGACLSDVPVASAVAPAPGRWWGDWALAVHGIGAGGLGGLAVGDALRLLAADGDEGARVLGHDPRTRRLWLVGADRWRPGQLVMVCDLSQSTLLRVHAVGQGWLDYVGGGTSCGGVGTAIAACGRLDHRYSANAWVVGVRAVQWFVRDNGRGGRSLFRGLLGGDGRLDSGEVVEGVEDLQLRYLVDPVGGYRPAGAVEDWLGVRAVRVVLTFAAGGRPPWVGVPLARRQLSFVVALRNRLEPAQ